MFCKLVNSSTFFSFKYHNIHELCSDCFCARYSQAFTKVPCTKCGALRFAWTYSYMILHQSVTLVLLELQCKSGTKFFHYMTSGSRVTLLNSFKKTYFNVEVLHV